ncbi:hypothetical protein HMPREF6123_2248 [Oribacterium sinus F0268]|uniref:Uncharacterized protein n=1 Tax=Oribacterium sinus F0268 TaxID=585501 RepID=C2L0H9_9FIRM|nr:hypothetical protein HMPREF6123_2248 [Oribacterium sinus F0268]
MLLLYFPSIGPDICFIKNLRIFPCQAEKLSLKFFSRKSIVLNFQNHRKGKAFSLKYKGILLKIQENPLS